MPLVSHTHVVSFIYKRRVSLLSISQSLGIGLANPFFCIHFLAYYCIIKHNLLYKDWCFYEEMGIRKRL